MNLKPIEKVSPYLYQVIYGSLARLKLKLKASEVRRFYQLSEQELEEKVSELFRLRQGRELDWENLKDYSEKMQWAKLYDKDARKTLCADKYRVRKWVSERIGEEYLIPLLGVWEHYSDIDFDSLPEQFVLKTNHGSNDAVIVKSKSTMTKTEKLAMRNRIEISLMRDYSTKYCEMHYSKIPARIIAEQFMSTPSGSLNDYKFLCFDGVPYFCWVDVDRFTNHKRNVYDMEWKLQPWNQRNYGNTDYPIEKPDNFEEMVRIVKILAKGFSHVRVDLYNIDEKIYFGEMTFTNASGFEPFTPPEADRLLGDLWKLDMKKES